MSTEYHARDDMARSYDACLAAVRERVAAGGKTWEPKDYANQTSDAD